LVEEIRENINFDFFIAHLIPGEVLNAVEIFAFLKENT
jgi:hypothetical protein